MKNNKNIMAQFTEVLKNNPNHAYDFISNSYWKMDKAELADIVKELLYEIYSSTTQSQNNMMLEHVGLELDELYTED